MNMSEINKCPVCGETDLFDYDICPICGWQNDPIQKEKPDMTGGANKMSLNQAIVAYTEGGKIE